MAGWMLDDRLTFRTHPVAVVEAPPEIGQCATCVSQVKLQAGVFLQHAAEDEVRRRQGGIGGEAHEVCQVVFAHLVGAGGPLGVDEDRHAQRLHLFIEGHECRVIKLAPVNVGQQFQSPQSQLVG